ncbi:MAG: hypothetical protein ACTHJX_01185 [Terriglobales bacterium]
MARLPSNADPTLPIQAIMGDVVKFSARRRALGDKRRLNRDDYVRGQQVLANAIFHWKNDPASDARAAVRFLLHHLATAFRADDSPLQPRPVHPAPPSSPAS